MHEKNKNVQSEAATNGKLIETVEKQHNRRRVSVCVCVNKLNAMNRKQKTIWLAGWLVGWLARLVILLIFFSLDLHNFSVFNLVVVTVVIQRLAYI